jgi:RHS repeat-associated protein
VLEGNRSTSRTTTFSTDSAGRVTGVRDPLNGVTTRSYDVLDRITRLTHPTGSTVQLAYDPRGNLLTHIDPKGNTTTYTYDAMNSADTRKDALLKLESYAYETGGRLGKVTDRKLQVSGMTYDALGRATSRGFGATPAAPTAFANAIAYTWDKANRLTQFDDSSTARRTVLRYDGLDRLLEEETLDAAPATPVTLSKVTYTYDAGGRRTSMTPLGQPSVTYTWDDANRLTQIQQAAHAINSNAARWVSFAYDAADRRTRTNLANGATTLDYGYDDASQVVSLTYKKADGTSIGDLTYAYDGAGRRTRTAGSLSATNLPNTITSATYDANNRLTAWNGVPFTYDDNGNLLNDGSLTYTWNARDELAGVSGAASATFAYDGFGRRIKKTVGGVTTGYVYDGMNFVVETDGAGAFAGNTLTGLGLDESYMRVGLAGATRHFVTDANNNTLRLLDVAGAVTDSYGYEPYGKTTAAGTSGNSQQYTGRENDNTGLYYYRARYYHPTVGRFVSEDPIGLAGGANVYAYVGGNPASNRDPKGLATVFVGGGGSYVLGAGGEGSGGLYLNTQDGDVGGYLSSGYGWGMNISAGWQAGWVAGDLNNFRGEFDNFNWVVGPFSGTVFYSHNDFQGASFGFGPNPIPVGASATKSNTIAGGLRDIFNSLRCR